MQVEMIDNTPSAFSKHTFAYTYLPASVDAFLAPEALVAEMVGVGMRNVRYERLALGTAAIHVGIG